MQQHANPSVEKCPVFITALEILFLSDDRKRTVVFNKYRLSLLTKRHIPGLLVYFTPGLLHTPIYYVVKNQKGHLLFK